MSTTKNLKPAAPKKPVASAAQSTKPKPTNSVGNDGSGKTSNLIKANILALAAVFLLSATNIGLFAYAQTKKTEVIAVSESGEVRKAVPITDAFVASSRVLSFVSECLRSSFSHDFENYIQTMNSARDTCYTVPGGKEFTRVMDPTLLDIKNKRVVLSVEIMPPALTRGPFMDKGRPTWEVTSVVTLYFQGTREKYTPQMRSVSATVVRVPIEEDPRGIRINAIQFKPYRSS